MGQDITITTKDGFSLHANLNETPHSHKGIIFVHGIANERNGEEPFVRAAQQLQQLGFTTLLFDLRAHGKSSGESIKDFTITSQIADIEAVVAFMKSKGIIEINLAGASFGGGACALYIAKYPNIIKSLLLENPVLDYNRAFLHPTTPWAQKYFDEYENSLHTNGFVAVGSKKYALGPVLFEEMKKYKPYEALQTFSDPLLLIHGDKDRILSYEDSIELFEKLKNPRKKLTLITGGEHGFHTEPYQTQATEHIVSFFVKTVKPTN